MLCFLHRFIDFRDPDGKLSKFYWHLLTLKLAFVILFEVSKLSVRDLFPLLKNFRWC